MSLRLLAIRRVVHPFLVTIFNVRELIASIARGAAIAVKPIVIIFTALGSRAGQQSF